MPRSRPTLLSVVLAGAILVGACGSDGGPPAAVPAPSKEAPAFPVTVRGEQGEVTITRRPGRIVSLSPSLTEMLYAIGAASQVAAVDRHSNHPAGTPSTDLSGFRPNVEAIAGYEPDLVVLANDRDGVVGALTNLGVPTLLLSSPEAIEGIYGQIGVLGLATGHPAEATKVAEEVRTGLRRIAESAPERARPLRYFYELSDTHHSVTSDTFIGQVLALGGLVSIADGADSATGGYPQLSAEHVLDSDPDVIFLSHSGGNTPSAESVAARPGWGQLRAVRESRVVLLDPDISSRWGPRTVDLLRAVVDATASLPGQ